MNKQMSFNIALGVMSMGLGALLAACDKSEPPAGIPPGMEMTHPDIWTPSGPSEVGPGSLDPVVIAEGKVARRVSVDQLRRSIPALFDGIEWTVPAGNNGRQQAPGFTVLSRTLGEADYLQATASNLDASPLFAKFMDDMAGDVCTKALEHDRAATMPAQKVLLRETDIDANLRWLRLKLHALDVPAGSTDGIADLRRLYDEVVAETSNSDDGWYAVCVAMLTAPEMMAY
jgi:hypothetical protein